MNVQKELENKLREIRASEQFVIGVVSFADTEDNMQVILDYIRSHPNCNDQDVSWLAYELHEIHKVPQGSDAYKKLIAEWMDS